MSIVVSLSGATTSQSLYQQTMTAQSIITCCSQDVRSVLGTSGGDQTILLDYVNRIHKEMLRGSNWQWLLSAPQRFVTEYGVTNYWIGTSGSNTSGTQDTGLNLTNVRTIAPDTVWDLSNNRQLFQVPSRAVSSSRIFEDGSSRLAKPDSWEQGFNSPYVLRITPAADNQNTYQPVPNIPICQTSTAGALSARTYFVKTTFVDTAGNESTPCAAAARTYVPANSVLVVKAPQPNVSGATTGILYSRYNVYVGTTEGSETKQASNQAITGDWTEPGTGLVAGAALPTINNIEPLRGYVIEFKYFRTRKEIVDSTNTLLVPDDYKDIFCAGVNALAYQFLKRSGEAKDWYSIYQNGMRGIIRDMNLAPHIDFMLPAQ